MDIAAVTVGRAVLIVIAETKAPDEIVPLQPLATKPVTEPLVPAALPLMPERLQAPLPIPDMVLNLPVPADVLYGFGVIVADAGPAKEAVTMTAMAATIEPRLNSFMNLLLIV